MGLDFSVSAAVLVPRPETELLVETVEKEEDRQAPLRILDMGTGSGAIIISLLHHFTTATGRGVDISAEALAVAKKTAKLFVLTASSGQKATFLPTCRRNNMTGLFPTRRT